MSIDWLFPTDPAGVCVGLNDSGIETFRGERYSSLAREVLQNSLDAKDKESDKPVTVTFELIEIDTEELPGVKKLREIMGLCHEQSTGDNKEKSFFSNAFSILKAKKIPCLKIDDYHTTGLRGGNSDKKSQWFAITKMPFKSVKDDPGAGGSYGIGKNAPFAASDLRTVFYYTLYQDKNKIVEKMQGRSVLMSYQEKGNTAYKQSVGYYGIMDGYHPIEDPKDIIPLLRRQPDATGTTIFIPGFPCQETWVDEIASIVLSNFFYAVYSQQLEVIITSNDGDFCIDKSNLESNFSTLLSPNSAIMAKDDYAEKLRNAKAYLDAINNLDSRYKRRREDSNLGNCELCIMQQEGLPQKVAFIRQTGMLITDDLKGLKRFSNMSDFAAVLLCLSDKGNVLLRKMENPEHNKFQPERLDSPDEKEKGKAALKSITEWIKKELKDLVGEQYKEAPTPIMDLAEIMPNENDESISGDESDSNVDRNIEGTISISPRPHKKSFPSGGPPHPPGPVTAKRLPIKNFKILKSKSVTNRVVFTPTSNEKDVEISIYIAGDSTTEKMGNAKVTQNGKALDCHNNTFILPKCEKDKKIYLDITFDEEISYPLAIELVKRIEEDSV